MQELDDLTTLIKSRIALIVVETQEEVIAVDLLKRVAGAISQPLFKWTVTEGLQPQAAAADPQKQNIRPQDVLAQIKAGAGSGLYLLLDFHPYLQDPLAVRLLKEVVLAAEQKRQTVILLSHSLSLPPEFDNLSARFELKLPGKEQLMNIVSGEIGTWSQNNGGRSPQVEQGAVDSMVRNLQRSIRERSAASDQAGDPE